MSLGPGASLSLGPLTDMRQLDVAAMLIATLLFLFVQSLLGDELISARCQSKCLHDMEHRYQDNDEQRRNLKHQIIQMCKDDVLCSACAVPCRESFITLAVCKDNCKESMDQASCEQSCDFLERIYKEKPGACPKMTNSSNYECTALCHLDGDCGETAKCCSYGCSRQCVQPKGRDPRLLPVPITISIQERKRRRSIIIRWVMQKLSKEQANANANLFVVQWRWGLHTDSMTEWQTVTVRNKPYAILKHLLSPGRFYEFRVGAVSQFGSLGFSKPSAPFKLSKEAKAPGPPKDLALGAPRLTPVGLWNQMVQWAPPPSDLPIKNYQVSWAASSSAEADSFEEMMRRRATLDTHDKRSTDEDDDAWSIEARDRHSVVIPSHTTQTEIAGLFPNSVYIVEIHSVVESTEGELQGEKGIIFVRTADAYTGEKQETSTTTTEDPHLNVPVNTGAEEFTPAQDVDVQTPFFEDGELQTTINWLDARVCGPGRTVFVVKVKKGECREYQTHTMDARWHDIRVNECAATLRGLSFDCDYHVQIVDNSRPETAISTTFTTQACDKTPSAVSIPCLSLSTPLLCSAQGATVSCKWSKDRDTSQDTVIGYRVVLSSTNRDVHNITINPPQSREISYDQLKEGEMYTVEVQSITNKGMGNSFSTNFIAPTLFDSNLISHFPGGAIIELPLEASSSTRFSLVFALLFLLLRLV